MNVFSKPALTIDEQVNLWESRGLFIQDKERVKRYLNYISYYRISPYTLPFQKSESFNHEFRQGISFDNILDLYTFDREFRLLVMDPIERIEVALRASITNHMSVKYEPHWYLDKILFKDRFDHNGFILKIKNEITEEKKKLNRIIKRIDGSNESIEIKERKKNQEIKQNFLRHYLSKYDTPELPPCWMMVELLSMGQLNMLLDNLARNIDQKNIALPFCVPFPLLISWLRSIQTVRNICAHHGRLWNRELGTPPQLPKTKHLHNRWINQPIKLTDRSINPNIRIYIVLVIIQYLLFAINPGSEWKLRLSNLMKKYPNVSKANMGMPDNWYEDLFWSL